MSSESVARASGSKLSASPTPDRFYRVDEKLRASGRYKAFEGSGTFLGRQARMTYAFLDGRLVAYYVFIEDADGGKLDGEMRERLMTDFGKNPIPVEDSTPLKLIWSGKDLIVNYWILLDELRMVPKYRAGFGARYLPLEKAAAERSLSGK